MDRANGIFISEFQRSFKWLGLVDYLAYRVMDGLVPDAKYAEWLPEIKKAPVRIAVHNFRNRKTALEQFDAFKRLYGGEAHILAGDYEDTYTPMSKNSAEQYELFLDMLFEEWSVPVISYSNASTYANNLNPYAPNILKKYGLWVVRFAPDGADINTALPNLNYYGNVFATDWEFWQFGWKGNGEDYGVGSENVCLDVFNGTVEQLHDFAKIAVEPQPDDLVTRVNKLEFLYQELNTDLDTKVNKLDHETDMTNLEDADARIVSQMGANRARISELQYNMKKVREWIEGHKHKIFWWMK